jgi:hypothetical protein
MVQYYMKVPVLVAHTLVALVAVVVQVSLVAVLLTAVPPTVVAVPVAMDHQALVVAVVATVAAVVCRRPLAQIRI